MVKKLIADIILTMKRILTKDIPEQIGKKIMVEGWIESRRDHGKLIFLDIRDRWGIVQVVCIPSNKEAHQMADKSRLEFVVRIQGEVNKRPDNMINEKIPTGKVEILAESFEIVSESGTPPFEIDDTAKINEEVRLTYRYLDLRTKRMQKNLIKRHEVVQFIRQWLSEKDFTEVETPILSKSTPEGARDYVVPSRLQKGKFYALPQAPQQYKQLLMVGGLERYFQIARCFRDEDLRGDRQPEFTQLDLEMSFVDTEDILNLIEELFIKLIETVYPDKKFTKPFPRITWKESKDKYKSDKPDIRKNKKDESELAFVWVTDFPLFEYDQKEKRLDAVHHPFTNFNEEDAKLLDSDPTKIRSKAYDLVLNGEELGSGSIRIHDKETQKKIFELLGISDKEIKERFGHFLKAFKYGVPPHGGMALGIDRLMMVLEGEESIREVIAFPKTQEGRDLMMDAPSSVDPNQLKEIHIKEVEK